MVGYCDLFFMYCYCGIGWFGVVVRGVDVVVGEILGDVFVVVDDYGWKVW